MIEDTVDAEPVAGTLTVEKPDKVSPIEADCFPVPVDVGRDRTDDEDLVLETILEMPDAVSDVISESSEVENDVGDDDFVAFTEVEKVVTADVVSVLAPPEVVEETIVDESVLEDVMLYVGVGIEVIPTLDFPPELPPCNKETDEDPPSPTLGVGTTASPEEAFDIESDVGSDGTVVAPNDGVRSGIFNG